MHNGESTFDEADDSIKKETVSELAQRHLKDESHTTTEEELRNAELDVMETSVADNEEIEKLAEADNTTILPPLPSEPTIEKEAEESRKDPDDGKQAIPNPYDIL